MIEADVVDVEMIVIRFRVNVVGGGKVVVRARKVRDAVGGAGGRGHETLEGAEAVPSRGRGRWERRRDRRNNYEREEAEKKRKQRTLIVARGGRAAQERITGPHT